MFSLNKLFITFAAIAFTLNACAMENPNSFSSVKPGKEEVSFKGEKERKELTVVSKKIEKIPSSELLKAPKELTASIFDSLDIQEKNKRIAAAFAKVNQVLDEIERFPSSFKDCYDDIKFLGKIKNTNSLAKLSMPLVSQQYEGLEDHIINSTKKLIYAMSFFSPAIMTALAIREWKNNLSETELIAQSNLYAATCASLIFFSILANSRIKLISREIRSAINADSHALNTIIAKQQPEADYVALTNLVLFIKENMAAIRESLNEHQQNITQLISPLTTLDELPTLTVTQMEEEIQKQVGVLKTAKDILAINKAIKNSGLWMLLASFNLLG